MSPSYGSFVKEACELLDKFRAEKQSLDDFIEDALKDLQNVDALQQKFILDVVSGCIQNKKLVDVVINMFYGQNKKWVSKADHSQFVIICYLTMFALDDLGLQNFRDIIKSLGINKMQLFLDFFFSHLTLWIQDEWNGIYDADFVEKEWIGPLNRWRPEISTLMDQLSQESQVKKVLIKTTQPQEFNLSKPKPRPQPETIPQQEKHNPVQKSTYSAQANGSPVKLNNAAILRQEALYLRQMDKELQRIEQLAQGARDPLTYLQWHQEILERDLEEKLPMMKQKHLEARISEEKVAQARKQISEQNQKAAQLKKEETVELMQKYAEKRMQEERELRDLVQQVSRGHKNSTVAKEKLQKLKQNIVKEVSKHNQELLRQALEEQQELMCKKFQLIREIRSIESLPRSRLNNFDDTETTGHLMGEMSLAELKERLILVKQSHQKEQKERHSQILQEKHKKKQEMRKKIEIIEFHRRELAKAAADRKEEKKAKQKYLQQLVDQDEMVLALKKKLEEQKRERQKLRLSNESKTKPQKPTPLLTETLNQVKNWEEMEQDLALYIQDFYDSYEQLYDMNTTP